MGTKKKKKVALSILKGVINVAKAYSSHQDKYGKGVVGPQMPKVKPKVKAVVKPSLRPAGGMRVKTRER